MKENLVNPVKLSSDMQYSDKEIIKGLFDNDSRVINSVYKEFRPKFCSYFRTRYKKDEDYVVDLFQDSFIAVYDNIQSGKLTEKCLTSSLQTYIISVGKYSLMAKDRKTHTFDQESLDHEMNIDEDGNLFATKRIQKGLDNMQTDEVYYQEKTDLEDYVDRMVGSIGHPCAELLTLFYWEKKSMEEIAQKMNFSGADSAKSQKSKCMKKLTPLIHQYQRL